jgi:hypothetical protein
MVEKKFNFYNVYNLYYKNINKSVFFFNLNLQVVFDDFTQFKRENDYFENYFGMFEILRVNYIKLSDFILLNTIYIRRKEPIKRKIYLKKIFNHNYFSKFFLFNYMVA